MRRTEDAPPAVTRFRQLGGVAEFVFFAHPPYGLRAGHGEVQEVFEAVCDVLVPAGEACGILDWAGPELLAVRPGYLEPGTERRGTFPWAAAD